MCATVSLRSRFVTPLSQTAIMTHHPHKNDVQTSSQVHTRYQQLLLATSCLCNSLLSGRLAGRRRKHHKQTNTHTRGRIQSRLSTQCSPHNKHAQTSSLRARTQYPYVHIPPLQLTLLSVGRLAGRRRKHNSHERTHVQHNTRRDYTDTRTTHAHMLTRTNPATTPTLTHTRTRSLTHTQTHTRAQHR
jgi:hypothetical protein